MNHNFPIHGYNIKKMFSWFKISHVNTEVHLEFLIMKKNEALYAENPFQSQHKVQRFIAFLL